MFKTQLLVFRQICFSTVFSVSGNDRSVLLLLRPKTLNLSLYSPLYFPDFLISSLSTNLYLWSITRTTYSSPAWFKLPSSFIWILTTASQLVSLSLPVVCKGAKGILLNLSQFRSFLCMELSSSLQFHSGPQGPMWSPPTPDFLAHLLLLFPLLTEHQPYWFPRCFS